MGRKGIGLPLVGYEGLNINSEKAVKRYEQSKKIIEKLEAVKVLLIKSPPMSGKTSMASLVSNLLVENAKSKILVINISMVDFALDGENWKFEDSFGKMLGIRWADLRDISKNRDIYLVLDESQIIYNIKLPDGTVVPNHGSGFFWSTVKSVLSAGDNNPNIRVLLFAAYGSSAQNGELFTPIQFHENYTMFGIDCLYFQDDEITEYVLKNFNGVNYLLRENTVELFCKALKGLVGSHVGLCVLAIKGLNDLFSSDFKYPFSDHSKSKLSSDVIIKSLWHESVSNELLNSRALRIVDSLNTAEFDEIKKILYGDNSQKIEISLYQKGIVYVNGGMTEFISPVMRRYFTQKLIGNPITRALKTPPNLEELILNTLSALEYSQLKSCLGRTKSDRILLERAWQMEFYKSAYQCTPKDLFISADVGALFDAKGSIDFTIHTTDLSLFWGIELLREANRINEHLSRFDKNGRYASLCRQFTDYGVVDFRMLESDADFSFENLTIPEKLFIVFYDESFSKVFIISKSYPKGKQITVKLDNLVELLESVSLK